MRFHLLQCLAHAAVKHGARFLLNLAPGGDVLYEIAVETWDEYQRDTQGEDLRAELQALAQAPAEEVRRGIGDAVREAAADHPATVREALSAYLAQVPAAVRRSLRRPSDPSGTTVPAGLTMQRPEDLMALLPPRPPRFKPGERPLPGVDWELDELVGTGGFGEVWRARHPYLQSKPPVALKFCLDQSAMAALRNEAGVLDRVMRHGQHAGIVPLLHTYLTAEPPCLEYEYVEGGDLASLIQEMHERGPVPAGVANRLLRQLAEVVAFAHQAEPPIVHGDLKPANVLVQYRGGEEVVLRVTDFGIGGLAAARAARETRLPSRSRPELLTEAVRGAYTPLYASPQQMARRPGERADPRDDVHALGVIWFQLLTGNLDMTSVPTDWQDQVRERDLSAELMTLLASCFAPKAEKRPPNATVLLAQLNAALAGAATAGVRSDAPMRGSIPVATRLDGPTPPPMTEARPPTGSTRCAPFWPMVGWLGAAGGVVLLVVIALVIRSAWREPPVVPPTAETQKLLDTLNDPARPVEARVAAAVGLGRMGPRAKGAVLPLNDFLKELVANSAAFQDVLAKRPFRGSHVVDDLDVAVSKREQQAALTWEKPCIQVVDALAAIGPAAEAAVPLLIRLFREPQLEEVVLKRRRMDGEPLSGAGAPFFIPADPNAPEPKLPEKYRRDIHVAAADALAKIGSAKALQALDDVAKYGRKEQEPYIIAAARAALQAHHHP